MEIRFKIPLCLLIPFNLSMRVGVFTYDTMHNYRFFGNNRTVKRYEKRKVTGASLGIFANRKSSSFFHN